MRIAMLGAGLMGSQIGCEYALGGCTVTFLVRDRARAERRLSESLRLVADEKLASPRQEIAARRHIEFHPVDSPLRAPVDLIVESLPEDIEIKAAALRTLAATQPDALFATNTSSISITALGDAAGIESRIVGTHYWNPPLLMPLVEVVAGSSTPPEALRLVLELLRAIGKRPVLLEREVPGFLWNRLQSALLRECLWLVDQGVASPQAIDEVVRDGLARRMRLTGPFETVALGGAATFEAIAANLFSTLSNAEDGSGFAGRLPADPAELAALRTRRDNALAHELRSERDQARTDGLPG